MSRKQSGLNDRQDTLFDTAAGRRGEKSQVDAGTATTERRPTRDFWELGFVDRDSNGQTVLRAEIGGF